MRDHATQPSGMMHFMATRVGLTVLAAGLQLAPISFTSQGQMASNQQHSSIKKLAFEAGWTASANSGGASSGVEGVGVAGSGPIRASIYVRDPIESKARFVAEGVYPSWSPDGSRLAYCSVVGAFYGQIHIVNADGKGGHQLTHLESGACFPEWSPDGKEMAITLTTGFSSKLAIIDENGTVLRELGPGSRAHWSPDGKQLVYVRPLPHLQVGNSIWIMKADGSDAREILEDHSPVLEANWLPGGAGILFASRRDGLAAAYIVDLDGKNMRKLGGDPLMNWFNPLLSPDGKSLIVDGVTPPDANVRRVAVVEIRADSHSATMLTVGNHFSVVWGQTADAKAQRGEKDSASTH